MPPWLDPRIVARPRRARDRAAVHPPGGGDRGRPCRRGRRRRHADGVGQDAVLRPARPPGDRRGPGRPRPVPVPDEGPRPGPGDGVRRAVGGGRPVDHHLHLRRRHAGPDPVGGPRRRAGRRDQPGHAPLGDPSPSHEVVPAVRAAPAHRHRRAPHVPRRVRRPRRQRPAPAAADLRALRQPAGHRVLLGDDREPGRARHDAHRATGTARRSQRRAGRRAPRPARRSAGHWTRERRSRLGRDAGPALGAAVPARRPPDDRVRPVARRGRAAADRPARVAARELRAAQPRPRLPRRLPADGAPRHRARPARRGDPRRRRDQRARARRRHRPAGRLDPGRLSGLRGGDVAAVRSGRPAAGHERRDPRGVGRAGRSVRHPPPGVPARGHAGGGAARPGQPARPAGAPAGGDLRAAVRAGRGVRARRRPTTCSRSSPRSATSARPPTAAGTGPARTSRRPRSRCGPRHRRTS